MRARKKEESPTLTFADGSILRIPDGVTYVVIGGAAFPVDDGFLSHVNLDVQEFHTVTENQIMAMPRVPRDGTVIREYSDPSVYIVIKGAKFGFASWRQLANFGITGENIILAPKGVYQAIPDVPHDGTLLQEVSNRKVYVVERSGRYLIRSPQDMQRHGLLRTDVVKVPDGSLYSIPYWGVLPPPLVRRLLRLRIASFGSMKYAVAIWISLVLGSAYLELVAEKGAGKANIQGFGDAVWWAVTTVTTVGYGDRYPVTTAGRFIAASLMIFGYLLLGVIVASFATLFIRLTTPSPETNVDEVIDILSEVRALSVTVAEISAKIDEQG